MYLNCIKRIPFLFLFLLASLQISLAQSPTSTVKLAPTSIKDGTTDEVKKKTSFQKGLADAKGVIGDLKGVSEQISEAVEKVKNNDVYQTIIDGKALEFPFAVLKDNLPKDYALIVNKIEVTATGTFAEIFLQIHLRDKKLQFLARNVPIGGNSEEEMYLYLVKTDSIKVGGRGYQVFFNGLDHKNDGQLTYVSFDCKGFKNLSLDGKVKFNPETISQVDAEDTKPLKKTVRHRFLCKYKFLV